MGVLPNSPPQMTKVSSSIPRWSKSFRRAAIENDEPGRALGELGRQRNQRHRQHGERRLIALANHQQVAAALALEDCSGRPLDGVWGPQPERGLGWWRLGGEAGEGFGQEPVLANIGRGVAFEDDGGGELPV